MLSHKGCQTPLWPHCQRWVSQSGRGGGICCSYSESWRSEPPTPIAAQVHKDLVKQAEWLFEVLRGYSPNDRSKL